MGVGKQNVKVVSVYSLVVLQSPWSHGSCCQGVPALHSGLEGGFPTNLISPDTELREGKEVGSSTVTAPEAFETMSVTHMFPGDFMRQRRNGVSQLH